MPYRNIDTSFSTLSALSPLDGRYRKALEELSLFFSEEALMKYRVRVEIEYLIALSQETKIPEVKLLSSARQRSLRMVYEKFDRAGAKKVKYYEKQTNHDVKAVEYYLRDVLQGKKLTILIPWLHFALTSEDINNLAYALMWQDALRFIYIPSLKRLNATLRNLAHDWAGNPLLSLTHGQPATPTTIGKEVAVYVNRLKRQTDQLETHKLWGKLGGATGTWSAHVTAFPKVNWPAFGKRFVSGLGLHYNPVTTQIESHDTLAESFHTVIRINNILKDACRDIWLYISRGILDQKKVAGEVGSSTMPHKINPIQFENAEGNLGLANAILNHLAETLQTSRLQRDLSDSTVIRNQGIGLGYAHLAVVNMQQGLTRISVNVPVAEKELEQHWEVLAEAIQTLLRKNGTDEAYEVMKRFTRGKVMTEKTLNRFITKLDLPDEDKQILLNLSPTDYTGLAEKLAKKV
ncbi:MAG: adenylosuccinate lyase [Fidelibacterota bacterium]